MRCICILWTIILFTANHTSAQKHVADSIRIQYHIPELAYAVVSSDSILTQQVVGVQRVGTNYTAQPGDCFRFGPTRFI